MSDKKFLIKVDMREQRSGVTNLLERSNIVAVEYSALPIGDYLLSDEVVVERKAATDFVLSIFENRLFGQVAQMQASYERSVIILEGDVFATRSAIEPAALRGAISWLSVIQGISLVNTRDAADTASFLEVMARHAQEGLGYEVSLRPSRPKDPAVLAQFAIEGLPGCGPTTAKKLLAHFGSALGVFNASVSDLCEVKGIGRKTAEGICNLLKFQVGK